MKKELALKLSDKAEEVASLFSQEREFNFQKETFTVEKVIPLSELTSVVIYKKSSDKKAIAFFYWLQSQDGHWRYFFPAESHIYGMQKLIPFLQQIEEWNYQCNFLEEKTEKAEGF